MVYKDGRFWPSLSFELQLAFAHVLRYSFVASLKFDPKTPRKQAF